MRNSVVFMFLISLFVDRIFTERGKRDAYFRNKARWCRSCVTLTTQTSGHMFDCILNVGVVFRRIPYCRGLEVALHYDQGWGPTIRIMSRSCEDGRVHRTLIDNTNVSQGNISATHRFLEKTCDQCTIKLLVEECPVKMYLIENSCTKDKSILNQFSTSSPRQRTQESYLVPFLICISSVFAVASLTVVVWFCKSRRRLGLPSARYSSVEASVHVTFREMT